jgi:type I restriction enzyme S subunit
MNSFPRVPLKRFGRIVGGSTPSADERFWGGPISWYTPTDVSAVHGGVLGDPERTLTDAGLAACAAALIPARSVVLTSRAPIGNVALTDRPAATNQGCKTLVPDARTDPRFVLYALLAFREEIQVAGTGTTFQEINTERLGAVRLPKPELRAQHRITEFLDREHERVRRAQGVAGQLRSTASDSYLALSRELIVQSPYPRVLVKLIATPGTGHTPSRSNPDYWVAEECHMPWFGLADVWQVRDDARDSVSNTAECISDVGLRNSAAVRHPAGTVFMSRTASVGFVGRMAVDMAVTQDFMTWTCGPRILPDYLLHALRAGRPEIMQLVQGSTHKTIYMPDLLNIKVPLPSLDQQRAIVARLQPRLEARRNLRPVGERLDQALGSYRDALIYEAVTGKLDIEHVTEQRMKERLHAASEKRLDEVPV